MHCDWRRESPDYQLKFFKYVLNLIEKILLMEEGRYPKMCSLRLKALAQSKSDKNKFNWYDKVGLIFQYINEKIKQENLNIDKLQEKKIFGQKNTKITYIWKILKN